ncbi:MAG: HTH domain-containing protein [Candidatus Coproplasma sp.]
MDVKSEILKQLDEHRGEYLSGESLSQKLGVTRQSVWKIVKKLVSEGYIIHSVTNRGYMLDSKCDLLSSSIIAERTGAKVFCYDEVSSTNTVAMQKLKECGECIVVAESQSLGRTKSGGSFASPSNKGVYMSVALSTAFPLENIDGLKQYLAESIATVLGDCCGTMPELSGENELYIHGKKACGILIEGEVNLTAKTVTSLVVGIGVYTAEVSEKLGYITSSEPRNALACQIFNAVKEIFK